MSEHKFHHYVPRFYLARFVDADGVLWAYDKSEDRIFRVAPERVAGENRFYDIPKLDEAPDIDRLLLENQFAEVESETAPIIGRWLGQVQDRIDLEVSDDIIEIISLFITLQLLRTAESKAQFIQFNKSLERLGLVPDPETAVPNVQIQILWDTEFVNKTADIIAEYIWIFAENRSQESFNTSDHPVLVKSADSKRWLLGPSALDRNVYLVFPLSPSCVLYCYEPTNYEQLRRFDMTVSPVAFTPDMVKHENSGQIGMSRRFVFANQPDFEFAREFLADNPKMTDPERPRFG